MKKFFVLLSFCLSFVLFSCSSLIDNQFHRTTSLIINLPNVSSSASRAIYEQSFIPAELNETAFFKVTISAGETIISEKEGFSGETIVFSELKVGTYTISGTVSMQNLKEFGFAKKEITLRAGPNSVNLNLTGNSWDKVKTIELAKPVTKNSYELGDSIDYTGVLFNVILDNGYVFPINYEQLSKTDYYPSIGFIKKIYNQNSFTSGEPVSASEYDIENTYDSAERYCYKIQYKILKGSNVCSISYSDAIINAKTPVITKQPESTYITRSSPIKFSFDVEIQNSQNLNDINFDWSCGSNFGNSANVTPKQEDGVSEDDMSRTSKYSCEVSNPNGINLINSGVHCTITNTDSEGINGKKESSITSTYVQLIYFDPNSAVLASNQNFIIQNNGDPTVSYASGTNFIYNGTYLLPSNRNFYVTFIYKTSDSNDTYKQEVIFTGEDKILKDFTVERIDGVNYSTAIGMVPYNITFKFTPYSYDSASREYTGTETEYSKIVYVPTKLSYIPDYTLSLIQVSNLAELFGINDQALQRYYDPETKKFYLSDIDNDYHDVTSYELNYLHTNTVSSGIYNYNESNPDDGYEYFANCFEPSFMVYKRIDDIRDNGTPINNIEYNSVYGQPFVNYKLSQQDLAIIESGSKLEMWISCTLSVKKEYEDWFKDAKPETRSTDTVIFTKYNP